MNSVLRWNQWDSSLICCGLWNCVPNSVLRNSINWIIRKRNKKDNDANSKELQTAIHLFGMLEKTAFWNLIHSSFVQIVTKKCMVLKCVYFQMPFNFLAEKGLNINQKLQVGFLHLFFKNFPFSSVGRLFWCCIYIFL